MLYGVNEVLDLYVFNEEGKFITQVKSLKESGIYVSDSTESESEAILIAKDALLNIDLLKFIQGTKDDNLTDFERYAKINEVHTITFNAKNKGKKCKLIAKSIMRNLNQLDNEYLYEIPNAYIVNSFSSVKELDKISDFDLKIEIKPYNEEKDLFQMKIYK